ncbi:unnamed protein product, partial [Oppiella nova]
MPEMTAQTRSNESIINTQNGNNISANINNFNGVNQPLRRLSISDRDFDNVPHNTYNTTQTNGTPNVRIIPITTSPPRVINNYQMNGNTNRVAPMHTPAVAPVPEKVGFNGSYNGGIRMPSEKQEFEVLWHQLSYNIKGRLFSKQSRRTILHHLNGYFRSSEVTAIMGPSGAGKSTLLEIIAGRRRQGVVGEVRIRGVDEVKIGFVPQDNYLMELLTVKETLVFASKLIHTKLDSNDHNVIADKVIQRFGLEKISDTKAKRCSGGQRKRLSIALEIVSKPNILILDEPTTGLDSPSCTHVLNILQELAANKTSPVAIIATIHQPSVNLFNSFHRIYVLTNRGRCIYQGPPRNLVPTLNRVDIVCDQFTSPADYIIEIAANDYGPIPMKKMCEVAMNQDLDHLTTMDTRPLSSTLKIFSFPFWKHLKLLYIRSQIVIYRDPFLTILRIIMSVFSAVSLSILFGREIGKTSGCPPRPIELYSTPVTVLSKKFETDLNSVMQNVCLLFLGIMVGFLSGLTPTLLNFPKEMQVFHKEYHNSWYSCITYYLAKVLSDVPLQVITPLIYMVITYWYSNQPHEPIRFGLLLFISIILSFLAQSIGECTSAIYMDNQNAAVFAGGLIPLPMILFGGFLVKVERMPVYLQPLSWLSFLRFAFEALMISTYGINRCEYNYQQFLQTVNQSAVTKPLWAESLPILMGYVDQKRGVESVVYETEEEEENANIERLYRVFGGGVMKEGQG